MSRKRFDPHNADSATAIADLPESEAAPAPDQADPTSEAAPAAGGAPGQTAPAVDDRQPPLEFLFKAVEAYTVEQVANRIGVPVQQLANRAYSHRVGWTSYAVQDSKLRYAYRGDDWVAWLRNAGFPILAASGYVGVWRRENPLPVPDAAPAEPPDLIRQAGDMLDSEKVGEAHNVESAWGVYVALLTSGDANPRDAGSLAGIMQQLAISVDQAVKDRGLLKRLAEIRDAADPEKYETAKVEVEAAGQAVKNLEQRHKAEEKAAQFELSMAWDRMRQANPTSRRQEARCLCAERSALFVGFDRHGWPKVRGTDTTTPAGA